MARRPPPQPVVHTDPYGGMPYGGGGTPEGHTSWEELHGLQFIGEEVVGEPFDQLPFEPSGPEPDLSATIVVPADHNTNDTGAVIIVEKGTWEGNAEVQDDFVPPYAPPPEAQPGLESITPASGTVGTPTDVTLTGSGFGTYVEAAADGVPLPTVRVSEKEATCTLPDAVSQQVAVRNGGGAYSNELTFASAVTRSKASK